MLFGERVMLRALQPDDHLQLARFKNDVEFELASGGMPPRPRTMADYEEFRRNWMGHEGDVHFTIEADAKVIGDCGLFNRNTTNLSAELGIGIGDARYWGRGYGRETIELLLDYGFRLQNIRRIWLEVMAENERAVRCYKACGFLEEGRLREHQWSDGRYQDVTLMAALRSERAASHS